MGIYSYTELTLAELTLWCNATYINHRALATKQVWPLTHLGKGPIIRCTPSNSFQCHH